MPRQPAAMAGADLRPERAWEMWPKNPAALQLAQNLTAGVKGGSDSADG